MAAGSAALGPLGPLGALVPLRPLGAFYALGAFRALVALDPCDTLGTTLAALEPIFPAIGAPVFATILAAEVFATLVAALGTLVAVIAQLDPQPVVVLAHSHALEVELGTELLHRLRQLLPLLRREPLLADAHLAHAVIEQRANLVEQLLEVEGARRVARYVEPRLVALVVTPVFAAVFRAEPYAANSALRGRSRAPRSPGGR